jgi:hypothetical protein
MSKSNLAFLKQHKLDNSGDNLIPETWVVGIIFVLTFLAFSRFVLGVVDQITKRLDIYCLTIK